MAYVSYSFWKLSWSSSLTRDKGGPLAPQNQLLRLDGARRPWKAVDVRERRPVFQIPAVFLSYPSTNKSMALDLDRKYRMERWRQFAVYIDKLPVASAFNPVLYSFGSCYDRMWSPCVLSLGGAVVSPSNDQTGRYF